MAFRRSSFSALKTQKKEYFESIYKFSKKVPNFKEGSDVYVIPLGLEQGFFETPCHRIMPHKVDGQLIGYGGSSYPVYVRCTGIDENNNESDSLCCQLAAREKKRCGEDWTKRIISGRSNRVHIPILILGNSTGDNSKTSYPITKVSILNDFRSESGLKFSYLDMAASSCMNDIVLAYGHKLKEEGVIDYETDEGSEEFYSEVMQRLRKTVIKIHGVSKNGFSSAMKEYSFFPFENPTIASGSGEEERKAITNYFKHKGIMAKVDEYLQLFNVEVDKLIKTWNEKDLIEYYNSAIGIDIKAGISPSPSSPSVEEKVEIIAESKPEPVAVAASVVSSSAVSSSAVSSSASSVISFPSESSSVASSSSSSSSDYEDEYEDEYANDVRTAPSDEDMQKLLDDPFEGTNPVAETSSSSSELDSFEYDLEEDDAFFEE